MTHPWDERHIYWHENHQSITHENGSVNIPDSSHGSVMGRGYIRSPLESHNIQTSQKVQPTDTMTTTPGIARPWKELRNEGRSYNILRGVGSRREGQKTPLVTSWDPGVVICCYRGWTSIPSYLGIVFCIRNVFYKKTAQWIWDVFFFPGVGSDGIEFY